MVGPPIGTSSSVPRETDTHKIALVPYHLLPVTRRIRSRFLLVALVALAMFEAAAVVLITG